MPHCLLLESAKGMPALGRFSFLTADPVKWFTFSNGTPDPFGQLASVQLEFSTKLVPGLPPFQGGLAGLLTYELGHSFEQLPIAKFHSNDLPAVSFGLFDFVLAWDREVKTGWLISQGLPEQELGRRADAAVTRADQIIELLSGEPTPFRGDVLSKPISTNVPPQFSIPKIRGLTSNFSRDDYLSAVDRAIEYIRAGDIFQVNLSQQLRMPSGFSSVELYRRLKNSNPATFSSYLDLGSVQIVSASPERLIACRDGVLESRPIKGTRKRTGMPLVDLAAEAELLASAKDLAENAMIVDLVRNDLSRVCEDDSVEVTQFREIEKYESVLHLVSAIRGKLRSELMSWDALQAIFPGGSVTGAPKIRAMEIITEIEQAARGAYCGAIGYVGLDGSMDFSILIRTVTAGGGWWQLPVGGAIVANSDPVQEYDETWVKAAGLIHACSNHES